jgi:polysaccharide export outer membrane protein
MVMIQRVLSALGSAVALAIALPGIASGMQPSQAQVAQSAQTLQPAPPKSADAVTGTAMKPTEAIAGDYVIGPDDVLGVVFWRDPQLSGDVLVRPDGKISLPLLDDIQAAGLTSMQLRDRLISEARRYVTEPIATVVVRQINSRKVYITGLVARPGQYPLTSASMNVLQLIATAGGLSDYAKAKDIRVMRVQQGHSVSLRFDYVQFMKENKTSQAIELKAGDIVVVP